LAALVPFAGRPGAALFSRVQGVSPARADCLDTAPAKALPGAAPAPFLSAPSGDHLPNAPAPAPSRSLCAADPPRALPGVAVRGSRSALFLSPCGGVPSPRVVLPHPAGV